jgi:hypothetical protein
MPSHNPSDTPPSPADPAATRFEQRNVEAYSLLLRVEVVLRELVREHRFEVHGEAWHKQLPGEFLKLIRDAQREENRPHYGFECLGPLYYLTFGQLATVLSQAYSKPLIDKLGGQPFLKSLEAISPFRNAVCHSRPIPAIGLQQISLMHSQLTQALSADRFNRYLQNPDVGVHPEDARRDLILAISKMKQDLIDLPERLDVGPVTQMALRQYWWRPDLAGFDIDAIERLMPYVDHYNQLARGIGASNLRHQFVRSVSLMDLTDTTLATLTEAHT